MERVNLVEFLGGLGRTSLQAGVLVLVVLAAQFFLRRQLSPRWRCSLWLLVVARLLLPVSVGSTVSLFNLLPRWTDQPHRTFAPTSVAAVADVGTPTAPVSQTPPQMASSLPPQAQVPETERLPDNPAPSEVPFPTAPTAPAGIATPQPSTTPSLHYSITSSLFWVWLAGAFGLGAYVVISSLRLARAISGLKPLTDPALLAVLADCQARMKAQTPLTLVESPAVSCPALYGFFHPRLVLPRGFATHFSQRELRFIFLHEVAHLKRRDLPLNWLIALLQTIHWFNPLVWIAFARWRVDRELACDTMALDAAGAEQNHEYGKTILRLLAGFARPTPTPGLVGILENKQQLRQRISTIASYVPARRLSLLAGLLVLSLGVVGLTDPKDPSPKSATAGTDSTSNRPSETAPQPRPTVTSGRAVKVTVLDKETGLPLAGAEVLAPNQAAFFNELENAPQWMTDRSGSAVIRLREIPAEPTSQLSWFTLSVRRPGYAPQGVSWSAEKGDARTQIPAELTVRLPRGQTIGGTITDPSGLPQPKVQVRAFGCSYTYDRFRELHQEYSEFWTSREVPGTTTDEQGRWSLKDFPRDLENVAVVVTRPDGSTLTFRHSGAERNPISNIEGEPLDLAALRNTNAVLVLKPGFTVEGTVVDPSGRPVPDVLVKEGYGAINLVRGADVRTDAAGKFRLSNRAPRQIILTACADGFAITSTIVQVAPNTPHVRLQLSPLRPLLIRVLDGTDRPIAGAKIGIVGFKTQGQVLDLDVATDQNGVFIWSNAPDSSFTLSAWSPKAPSFGNFGMNQMIAVRPGQKEITFRLREGMEKELIVHGRARDSKTGAPVVVKTIEFQNADRQGFSLLEEVNRSDFSVRVPASRFRQGMEATFTLRLEVDGHETLVTPWRDFLEGDWDTEFVFVPGGQLGGTVLLPDGKPAAGAEIAVLTREHLALHLHSPNQAPRDWSQVVRADGDGHFEFKYPGGDWAVVLMHKDGFLATRADRFKTQPRLTLQPWGRVEGVLYVGTNVAPRQRLTLTGGERMMNQWQFWFSADTDDQGRFRFDQVPPADCQLYRSFNHRSGRAISATYQMPLVVKPGEATLVKYGGTGRPLIGRVEGEADWNNDDHLLTLKLPPAEPHPRLEDFATVTAFEKARDHYYAISRPKQEQAARSYQLQFEPDGSFRVDDVPAGTYELAIRVTRPTAEGAPTAFPGNAPEIASLTREVIVPEIPGGRSDEPLDLGVLQLQWKERVTPKPALGLKANTLDGKPFDLAALRGTNVVLAFWAGWSERSTEELSALKKLYEQFAQDPRVAFWSISLDDDPEAVRKNIASRGYAWRQGHLDSSARAKVTAAFDVNTLPAVFLVDRQGRLIGRDLDGDRLAVALKRTLSDK